MNTNKIITITAGHSNTDPGAVNGKAREADIAVDMRNMVAYYLERKNITIRTDGKGKNNQPLSTALKLIAGSAVAVEFHCNSALNKTARGVEALAQAKDKLLCQKLCKAVSGVLKNPLRGDNGYQPENAGQYNHLSFVRHGGIILEMFFISNEAELAAWEATKWLVAKAVAEVLAAEVQPIPLKPIEIPLEPTSGEDLLLAENAE